MASTETDEAKPKGYSIYTAIGITEGRPGTMFQRRKLNLAPGQLPDVSIYGISSVNTTPVLDTVMKYIHMYTGAKVYNKVYPTLFTMWNVIKDIPARCVPVRAPVLHVRVTREQNDTEETRLRELSMERNSQSMLLDYRGSPNYDQFKQLLDLTGGLKDHGTPKGDVNGYGYLAFFYAWKAAAAYTSLAHSVLRNGITSLIYTSTSITKEVMQPGADVEWKNIFGYGAEGTKIKVDGHEKDKPIDASLVNPGLPVANPMQGLAWGNWTYNSHEQCSNTGGFIFPYFDGLLIPNKEYLGIIFFRHFVKMIANTPAELASLAPVLRKGFRDLAPTKQGLELQHLFFGIELSMQLGARLIVICEGHEYMGFGLTHGRGYTIIDKGIIRQPMSTADWNSERLRLSAHMRSIRRVKEILSTVMMLDGSPSEFNIDQIGSSSRKIANQVIAHDLKSLSDEDKKELADQLGKIETDETFLQVDEENFLMALQAITSGKPLPEDKPFYLGKGIPLNEDNIARVLACFGETAPTIFNGDQIRTIAKPNLSDPNLQETEGVRSLQYLPVSVCALNTAIGHWRAVRNDGKLKFFGPRKGRREFSNGSKTVLRIAGDQFSSAYSALREFVANKNATRTEAEKKGKKRQQAESMDVDEDASSSVLPLRAAKKVKVESLF